MSLNLISPEDLLVLGIFKTSFAIVYLFIDLICVFCCLIFTCSATVFGVSTESMQLSYDSRGNSVPTILLLMQRHLYVQGGLQVNHLYMISAYSVYK